MIRLDWQRGRDGAGVCGRGGGGGLVRGEGEDDDKGALYGQG